MFANFRASSNNSNKCRNHRKFHIATSFHGWIHRRDHKNDLAFDVQAAPCHVLDDTAAVSTFLISLLPLLLPVSVDNNQSRYPRGKLCKTNGCVNQTGVRLQNVLCTHHRRNHCCSRLPYTCCESSCVLFYIWVRTTALLTHHRVHSCHALRPQASPSKLHPYSQPRHLLLRSHPRRRIQTTRIEKDPCPPLMKQS